MRIGTCFFLATLLLGGALLTQRGQTSGGPKDALDKDYAAELPRIPATEPKDALNTFKLSPGFS